MQLLRCPKAMLWVWVTLWRSCSDGVSLIAGWGSPQWSSASLEASLSDVSCWVPWRWRHGCRGPGVPWCRRSGFFLAVPHCLVAATHRQHRRHTPAFRHLPPKEGCRKPELQCKPCDTGARWIPRSRSLSGYRWTQIAGQSGILSISRPYFWSFRLSERSSSHTII